MTTSNLIESHIPLADELASRKNKTTPRSVRFEELRSAAYYGLVDAASRYDGSQGPFQVYASCRIRGAMKDYLRELRWGTRANPLKSAAMPDVPSRRDRATDAFDKVTLGLDGRSKEALRLYYHEGCDQAEIAERMGVSKPRVCQIMNHSYDQIRSHWPTDIRHELWEEVA